MNAGDEEQQAEQHASNEQHLRLRSWVHPVLPPCETIVATTASRGLRRTPPPLHRRMRAYRARQEGSVPIPASASAVGCVPQSARLQGLRARSSQGGRA